MTAVAALLVWVSEIFEEKTLIFHKVVSVSTCLRCGGITLLQIYR